MAIHLKEEKICPVCGNLFNGTAKAQMCGAKCRVRMKRLRVIGKTPRFYLKAKDMGQKLPVLVISKTMTFEQKMAAISTLEAEIKNWQTRFSQGHPKMWAIKRDTAILELKNKIAQLKK